MSDQQPPVMNPNFMDEADSRKRLRQSRKEMDSMADKAQKQAEQATPGNRGFERFMDMHKESRGAKRMSGKGKKGWRYVEGPYKGMTPQQANRIAYKQWSNMSEEQRDAIRPMGKGDYASDRARDLRKREDEFKQDMEFDKRRRNQLGQGDSNTVLTSAPGGRTSRPDFSKPSGGSSLKDKLSSLAGKVFGGSGEDAQANKPSATPVSRPQPRGMIDGMPAKKAIRQATKRVDRMRDAAPKKSSEEYQRDMQSSRVDLAEKRQKDAERARLDSMRGPASNPEYQKRQADAIRGQMDAEKARKDKAIADAQARGSAARDKNMRSDYLTQTVKDRYGSVDKAPRNVQFGVNEQGGQLTPQDMGAPSYDEKVKADRMSATRSGRLSDTGAAAKTPVKAARRPGPRGKRI